jgi:hypothetical protein
LPEKWFGTLGKFNSFYINAGWTTHYKTRQAFFEKSRALFGIEIFFFLNSFEIRLT